MRSPATAILIGLSLLASAGSASAQEKGTLSFKPFKNFPFLMPKEIWSTVNGQIPLKHPGGSGFRTEREGMKLAVDTDGDGRSDGEVKGMKGYLLFRSARFRHALRFRGSNGSYRYAVSGAMSGKVGAVPIMVFDLNCNGVYNEFGSDALIIGKKRAASFLSKVISYKGELFELTIDETGSQVSLSPYQGEKGTLSLAKGYRSKGKLTMAVVRDEQGNSFELAGESKGLVLPTGKYQLVSGFVSKGSSSVRIRAGQMAALEVKAGQETKFVWGQPIKAIIAYSFDGTELKVDPMQVHFYGKGGEEYYDFQPGAKSPKFIVKDASSGREVGGFQYEMC
ncbi:MAG: hypothetical protein CSA62_14985 [Planctomycetota bacterium]|nr:MAG: hypothetical protein CSA62_14985 [Planctomycetota bacterium]